MIEEHAESARRDLTSAAATIASYLASSERVFLDVQSRLSALEERAGHLVLTAEATTTTTEWDPATDPVEALASVLAESERSRARSRDGLRHRCEGLAVVLRGIEELVRFESRFQEITLSFWALASSTRIENARCGGAGFETVVADVRRLGGRIDSTFGEVLARAAKLSQTAKSARDRAETYLLEEETDPAVTETRQRLESAHGMRQRTATIGEEAKATSERIQGEISSVLVALQSHDIARQILEHVVDELRALAASSTGQDAAPELATSARLQAGQIARARETLQSALADIAARLESIAKSAVSFSHDSLATDDGLVASIEAGMERTQRALVDQLARARGTTEAMGLVGAEMRAAGLLTKQIASVGAEIKIIALNAHIQAQKAGSAGRGLVSLAQAIRELALKVEAVTAEVAAVMTTISAAAAQLDSGGSDAGEVKRADNGDLLAALHAHHDHTSAQLTELAGHGGHLETDVRKLARALSEHGESVAVLKEAAGKLEALVASRGPVSQEEASQRLQSVASRYTTDHERSVHRALTSADAPAPPTSEPAPSVDGGFGDNVELF